MTSKKIIVGFFIAATFYAIGKPPVGMTNVGNSCFMNAPLQTLLACGTFNERVLAKREGYLPGSIAQEYINLHRRVQQSSSPITNQDMLLLCVQGWSMLAQPPRTQQDADQFLSGLLNYLIYQTDSASKDENNRALAPAPYFDILELFNASTGTELLHAGAVVSERLIERTIPLNLPVHPETKTLDQCIQNYFAPDEVNFKPEHLPGPVICEKRCSLEETNQYLIITAKRNGNVLQAISFPLVDLTIRPYFQDRTKDKGTYDLKAVIMHRDNQKGGHYTSCVNINDIWYYCDDRIIRRLTKADMDAIAQRGSYGPAGATIPTTFIYELSHLRRAAIQPEPVLPVISAAQRAAQSAQNTSARAAAIKRTVIVPRKVASKKRAASARSVKVVRGKVKPTALKKRTLRTPRVRRPVRKNRSVRTRIVTARKAVTKNSVGKHIRWFSGR